MGMVVVGAEVRIKREARMRIVAATSGVEVAVRLETGESLS